MIRAMTVQEIKRALRHAAEVCIADGHRFWQTMDVCIADATFEAACDYSDDSDNDCADTPAHAATFLLIVAEALE